MHTIPLTYLQQRQVEASADPNVGAGRIWVCLDLRGDLDVRALLTAVAEMVGRHDALRIRFVRDASGQLAQFARPESDEEPAITLQQVRCESEQQFLDHVRSAVTSDCGRSDDLESEPPARFFVFRLDPTRHVFAASFSRCVMDGRSRVIFLRELWEVYRAVRSTGAVPNRPPRPTFLQAAQRLMELNSNRAAVRNVEYWRTRLAPDPAFGRLGSLQAGAASVVAGDVRNLTVPARALDGFAAEAVRAGCTSFEVLFARVASVLSEILAVDRLAVLVMNDFRTAADRDVIGTFVGAVPVVVDREESGAVSVGQIQRAILRARVHGYLPLTVMTECYEHLRRETGVRMRDVVSFSYLDHTLSGSAPSAEEGLEIAHGPGVPQRLLSAPMLDILVDVQEFEAFVTLVFNGDVFPPTTADRVTDGLAGALDGTVDHVVAELGRAP